MMKMKLILVNSLIAPLIVLCLIFSSVTDAYQVSNVRRGAVVVPMEATTTIRSSTNHPPRRLHDDDDDDDDDDKSTTVQWLLSNTVGGTNLPPVIQQIANERAEFQINLGRAMDTLRKDMPYILSQTPDFSIYHNDISVIDPSGVQLKGIDKYKSAFTFLQTFSKFWFHQNSNTIQYRMVYDFCRNSIRISWHIVLISKFLPTSRPLHIDGISYYQLDVDSGKIIQHKIETLIVNNTPISPPYGILSILQQDVLLGNTMRPVPQGLTTAHVSSTR